jgi:hypothetical protein
MIGERMKSLESHGSSSQLFKSKKMIVQGELMKSLEGHGGSSLLFVMKKVMISHHRSNSHEAMIAWIVVLHIRSVVWRTFLCNFTDIWFFATQVIR